MLRSLCIDFNSYFASVEQQERPELRGRPVGVAPVMAESSGCIAVSIEAKARGLSRNVRVADARRLCPGIAIVEARPEVYIHYHRRLVEIIERCVHVEVHRDVMSIDEVMCDLTATFAPPDKAVALAKQIKAVIKREVGPCLRSSIGLAPNWLLAKVASDMEKPDGLVVLDGGDIPAKLLRLQPEDITGIGPNIAERLRRQGIDTMARLYAADLRLWRGIWRGVRGEQMWRLLHGENLPHFEQERNQTVGHGHVLPPELRNEAAASAVLHRLLQKAAMRLRHINHYAGGLHVFIACAGNQRWSDELRITGTQDTIVLTKALNQLLARRPAELRRRKPLQVGVALFHLLDLSMHTPDLFERKAEESHGRLLQAVDTLNRTFGKNSVYFGSALGATGYAPMRIAFTRIPQPELEEIDRSRKRRLRPARTEGKPPEFYE